MSDLEETYVAVATTSSRHQAELWALVLLSAGIANITEKVGSDYAVKTLADQADIAGREIGRFEAENRGWPPPKDLPAARGGGGRPPTVLLMGSLLIFYGITGPFASGSEWFRLGAADSRAILENGEWWRLITALTLHADPVHILGNLLIGGMIIHFLCRVMGTGSGWFLLMAAGTLGNLANAIARGPGHVSVGFSTAVFAAVGLLCGSQMKTFNLRGVLLPLGAGASLLAMLGSSGERTDLGAHLWGVLTGLLSGLLWTWLRDPAKIRSSRRQEACLLGFTIMLVWLAWARALAV